MKESLALPLSRRAFLKRAGLGVGLLSTSTASLALDSFAKASQGRVATAAIVNAGLLEQNQFNQHFQGLASALGYRASTSRRTLILLGEITDHPYPRSTDLRLLVATVASLQMQQVPIANVTIAYHSQSLAATRRITQFVANKAAEQGASWPELINLADNCDWQLLSVAKQLPAVKLAKVVGQADELICLTQSTDAQGGSSHIFSQLSKLAFADETQRDYSQLTAQMLQSQQLQAALLNKIALVVSNTAMVIAKETLTTKHLHPGLLVMSSDIHTQQLFVDSYLHTVTAPSAPNPLISHQLEWLTVAQSLDPVTIAGVERRLLRAGIRLKRVEQTMSA
ncbi:twin-arginine translocation signal domain-containing protein [Pseudoalteromonas fenneropenaei]|uniref:Twin-arginine translocation signal domain-containing protein n=1 Tax=Pseudoalteromonas fenneropenaei TaxID=1737459 RepID=A0ABV7CJ36_9GAMM